MNAVAVIADGNQFMPPVNHGHRHLIGAGVNTVVQQFLDDGRGPFNDFPGRDLACQGGGQFADPGYYCNILHSTAKVKLFVL